MSRSRTDIAVIMIAVCTGLAGCSDTYYARRDSIALSAGDAVKGNQVMQMVDPWPPYSSNRDIAFNGEKMQSAIERYRTNKVIPPVNATTSSAGYQQPSSSSAKP